MFGLIAVMAGFATAASPLQAGPLVSHDACSGVERVYPLASSRVAVRTGASWDIVSASDVPGGSDYRSPVFVDSLGGEMYSTGAIIVRTELPRRSLEAQLRTIWSAGSMIEALPVGVPGVYSISPRSCRDGVELLAIVEALAGSGVHLWVELRALLSC